MGWEVKNLLSHRSEKHVLFWAQNIKVPFGMGHPCLHIKSSLYVWRRAHGSQIFKQNSIISICSSFIKFFKFRLLWLHRGGAGGWGVSRVIGVSLDEFRNVQR